MTWRRAILVLVGVTAIGVATFAMTRPPDPAPECDSCSARHKDMERLRDVLQDAGDAD